MILRVKETTDGQWHGLEFTLDPAAVLGVSVEVSGGQRFIPDGYDMLPNGDVRFYNANYIAICEVVG